MLPGEYDEPDNELDRRLFHILSHGQKRQKEIVRLMSTARFSEKNVRRRVRSLSASYSWAEETEKEATTYYYRVDIGRQPRLQNPPADYSDIENILFDLEIKLGVKSQNDIGFRNNQLSTLPELFNRLLKKSNYHSEILTNSDHFERFFECFDQMLEQTASGYSSGQAPPNYPAKIHGLFYTLVARQHESWKEGQAHEDFDKEVRKRLDDLIELLEFVPPEIGNPVLRILVLVDIKKARIGFEKIIQSNIYEAGMLINHAESCYVQLNDVDELINDLNMIAASCRDDEIKEKINAVKNSIR